MLEPALAGLTFTKPVQLLAHPVDRDAWLVVEHTGLVHIVRGSVQRTYFDISDRVAMGTQWGLQEIAFHPKFPDDPRVFVTYVAERNVSTVASFRAAADAASVDADSETVLLSEPQRTSHHPIGGLAFGPDGYLYVGWGEGDRKSQDPALLGGKMLRIDVDHTQSGRPYAIPSDNPYIGTRFRPEVFAVGFRNPWRFTFDRGTGDLWVGDVGSRRYEEVDLVKPGANYGWPLWEGTECVASESDGRCTYEGFAFPVVQHSHAEMSSVTGGYVYHGKAIPALRGRYVYADHTSGSIWALRKGEDGTVDDEPIVRTKHHIGSFALDRDGELYAVDTLDTDPPSPHGFMIYKLVPAPAAKEQTDVSRPMPLSSLNCIARGDFRSEPQGLIGYTINHPPWEEGARTYRFASPDASMPVYGPQETLERPPGAVILKTFAIEGRPVETQMLARRRDGTWIGLDYEWTDDGSDALPVEHAKTKTLENASTWAFPGPDTCARCHSSRTGGLLGFSVSQMSSSAEGPDQLAWLEHRGLFKRQDEPLELLVPMAGLQDKAYSVEARARSYLHVNCAHCHQPGGNAGEAEMDLRRTTPLPLMRICGVAPSAEFPGHEHDLLISPGAPGRSLISARLRLTDDSAMPPQRRTVDAVGAAVVDEWIRGLQDCQP